MSTANLGNGSHEEGDGQTTLPPDESTHAGSEPVAIPKQWTNPENRSDINSDGVVSPLDLLLVINALKQHERLVLSDNPTDDTRDLGMIDANGDRILDKQDALIVFVDLLDEMLGT